VKERTAAESALILGDPLSFDDHGDHVDVNNHFSSPEELDTLSKSIQIWLYGENTVNNKMP
jgi:hypothetical protein